MNVLKEIKVKDAYLSLDKNIKNCQNEEPILNCTTRITRKYISSTLEYCGCLPSKVRFSDQVVVFVYSVNQSVSVCRNQLYA